MRTYTSAAFKTNVVMRNTRLMDTYLVASEDSRDARFVGNDLDFEISKPSKDAVGDYSEPKSKTSALRVANRYLVATVFPSEEAMKKYLEKHPRANPSKHSVKEKGEEKAPKKPKGEPKSKTSLEIAPRAFRESPEVKTKSGEPVTKEAVDKLLGKLPKSSKDFLDEKHKDVKAGLDKLTKDSQGIADKVDAKSLGSIEDFTNGWDGAIRAEQLSKSKNPKDVAEAKKNLEAAHKRFSDWVGSDSEAALEGYSKSEVRKMASDIGSYKKMVAKKADQLGQAIHQHGDHTRGEPRSIYRGLHLDHNAVQKLLDSDEIDMRGQHSSFTANPRKAQGFSTGNTGYQVLLSVKSKVGMPVGVMSAFNPNEAEVLVPGDAKFKITKREIRTIKGRKYLVIEGEDSSEASKTASVLNVLRRFLHS